MFSSATRLLITLAIVFLAAAPFHVIAADATCPRVGFAVVELHATSETRSLKVGGDRTVFVRIPVKMTG